MHRRMQDYDRLHDNVGVDVTTSLSAYNKFGPVSIRKVFHSSRQKLCDADAQVCVSLIGAISLLNSLFSPHAFGGTLKRKFDALDWDNNEEHFKAWCAGRTGFPIVDAGMRQLNRSGWMHNRGGLIVGSFLTRDLHIDRRWGQQNFARQLVDYAPCVNNGLLAVGGVYRREYAANSNSQFLDSAAKIRRPSRIYEMLVVRAA